MKRNNFIKYVPFQTPEIHLVNYHMFQEVRSQKKNTELNTHIKNLQSKDTFFKICLLNTQNLICFQYHCKNFILNTTAKNSYQIQTIFPLQNMSQVISKCKKCKKIMTSGRKKNPQEKLQRNYEPDFKINALLICNSYQNHTKSLKPLYVTKAFYIHNHI